MTSSPPPQAAGRTEPNGSRAKNFLPLNPSIFCPLAKKSSKIKTLIWALYFK